MKKLVMMCLVVSLVSVASAELVQNHDFSAADETPWAHMGYAAWGGSWVDLTDDYFRTGGSSSSRRVPEVVDVSIP